MSIIVQGKLNVDYINNRWLNNNQLTNKDIGFLFSRLNELACEEINSMKVILIDNKKV